MAVDKKQSASRPRRKRARGPWVHLACICDTVDRDGNILTLNRVIDVLNVFVGGTGPNGGILPLPGGELPPTLPTVDVNYALVISLKGDDFVGDAVLKVELEWPSGPKHLGFEAPLHFEGGGSGVNVTIGLKTTFGEHGTFWFDILIGRRLLTRVPFDVRYQLFRSDTAPAAT
jgi:hypothetical protein